MSVQTAKRLFTTHEYHRMAEAGILSEDDQVELIEGEIVKMSPIGSRHAACVDRLNALLNRQLGKVSIIRVQSPIVLHERSEPQPDIAVLRPRSDFYAQRHPEPADVILVVEVVDTSGEYERTTKVSLYARAGLPEVWLVDIPGEVVEVYRQPMAGSHQEILRVGRGRRVSLAEFPRTAFRVDDILG